MKILLVEDEIHKRDEVAKCIVDVLGISPDTSEGVKSAVLSVKSGSYDLIVLDMALPTFDGSSQVQYKGHDQADGGIEVLRALKSEGKSTKVIIITQYAEFRIGSTKVKLKNSPAVIREKYGQLVVGAILYQYKSKSTIQRINSVLRTCL
jgi:CheY-like chemotaxis protein